VRDVAVIERISGRRRIVLMRRDRPKTELRLIERLKLRLIASNRLRQRSSKPTVRVPRWPGAGGRIRLEVNLLDGFVRRRVGLMISLLHFDRIVCRSARFAVTLGQAVKAIRQRIGGTRLTILVFPGREAAPTGSAALASRVGQILIITSRSVRRRSP